MKGKKKNEKKVEINGATVNSMGGKKCYIRNTYLSLYLDTNNVGDVYFSSANITKWEFIKTDLDGSYFIKHIPTGLYLTSNEKGDIFTSIELNSTFQKWYIHTTTELEIYGYQNCSNELYISVNLKGEIYLNIKDENCAKTGLMYTFQFFPKK